MAAALRPRQSTDQVGFATRTALCMLGRRALALDAEKEGLDEMLERLVEKTAPELLGRLGVGVDTAATLLVTAGDNPGRIRSEAAWAHLCGVAPIQASSGKVTRVRLDRGGDRQANSALWVIVMAPMSADKATRAYVERRVAEGRSKLEVVRVLSATSPASYTVTSLGPKAGTAAVMAPESAGALGLPLERSAWPPPCAKTSACGCELCVVERRLRGTLHRCDAPAPWRSHRYPVRDYVPLEHGFLSPIMPNMARCRSRP
jgi:Transposase IS116/IS110/IS902 family